LNDERRHDRGIDKVLGKVASSLDDQFADVGRDRFIADEFCDDIVSVVLDELGPSVPVEAVLVWADKEGLEGAVLVVDVCGAGGAVVSRGDKVDCAGGGGAAVGLGDDGAVLVAAVHFEAGIVRGRVAVVQDFLAVSICVYVGRKGGKGKVHESRSLGRIGLAIRRTRRDRAQCQWTDRGLRTGKTCWSGEMQWVPFVLILCGLDSGVCVGGAQYLYTSGAKMAAHPMTTTQILTASTRVAPDPLYDPQTMHV